MEKDFKRIYKLAKGKIESIALLGGEPLLHSELLKIIQLSGKYFKGANLRLVTNDILLLKQDSSFWQNCKENNIKVIITKYPINLNFTEIEQIAETYGTILEYYIMPNQCIITFNRVEDSALL